VADTVLHADLELFLTRWYRRELAARPEPFCHGYMVATREPAVDAKTFPERLLIIRWDGSSRESLLTAEASVGISVLAGTRENPQDANDAARMVLALAEKLPALEQGNPVTVLRGSTGPIAIAEQQDRARRYLTLTLGVAGIPL
jgi:hypothetical protein